MEGDLLRTWKRSKKKRGWDNYGDIAADLREKMSRIVPIPQNMAVELAEYFLPGPIDEDAIYRLEEVLDIMAGQWDAGNSILNYSDYEFIKEFANAWALELDIGVLNQIMQVIVETGGFSSDP